MLSIIDILLFTWVVVMCVVALPILVYLLAKCATMGYFRAKRRARKEEEKEN